MPAPGAKHCARGVSRGYLNNDSGREGECPSRRLAQGGHRRSPHQDDQEPTKNSCCLSSSGTTLNLPCRTKGDSANRLFALTSASVTGLPNALPTLIFTRGFFASEASTETTVAIPTALFTSPVS